MRSQRLILTDLPTEIYSQLGHPIKDQNLIFERTVVLSTKTVERHIEISSFKNTQDFQLTIWSHKNTTVLSPKSSNTRYRAFRGIYQMLSATL